MWSSSILSQEEERSCVAPATIFPTYNSESYSANYWENWAPTSSSFGPHSYHHPVKYYGRYVLPESRPAPPPPLTTAPRAATSAHQVIVFHSSASWRAFFQASEATNKLIVVDFMATWCGPCRKMEPAIDEFAAKYTDVKFAKIDVDKLFDVSCEYGVQTMPTFLLMKNGQVVDKITGTRKEELQWKIAKYRV